MANKEHKKAIVYPIKISQEGVEITPSTDKKLQREYISTCKDAISKDVGEKKMWQDLINKLSSNDKHVCLQAYTKAVKEFKKFKGLKYDVQSLAKGPGEFLNGLVKRSENRLKKLYDEKKITYRELKKYLYVCQDLTGAVCKIPDSLSVEQFLDDYHGTKIGPNMRIYFMQNRGPLDLHCVDSDPSFIDEYTDFQLAGVHGGFQGGIDSNLEDETQTRYSVVNGLKRYFSELNLDSKRVLVTAEWCNPEIDHGYLDAQYISLKTGACVKGYHGAIVSQGYDETGFKRSTGPTSEQGKPNFAIMQRSLPSIKRVFLAGKKIPCREETLKSFQHHWNHYKDLFIAIQSNHGKRSAPVAVTMKYDQTLAHEYATDASKRSVVIKKQSYGKGGKSKWGRYEYRDYSFVPVTNSNDKEIQKQRREEYSELRLFKPATKAYISKKRYTPDMRVNDSNRMAKDELKKERKESKKKRQRDRSKQRDYKFGM